MSTNHIQIIDICDECVDTMHRHESTIEINISTSETACLDCGRASYLGQTELLEILNNLED